MVPKEKKKMNTLTSDGFSILLQHEYVVVDEHVSLQWYNISIGTRPFGKAQSKPTRCYVQSGQYHIIVKSRVHLIRCL